jgi:hypothetical protein
MIRCRKTVSTLLEGNRQKKAQEDAEKRKEEKKCRAAVVQATSLPRQEAKKRKMDDKLQPVLNKLRSMEEQLQRNGGAPTAADQDGAATTSATRKRTKMRRQREAESECEEASSKMKKVKHNPNQKQMKVTTTPTLSNLSRDSSRRNDHPRKMESSGKSRPSEKRRKLKVTVQDQE